MAWDQTKVYEKLKRQTISKRNKNRTWTNVHACSLTGIGYQQSQFANNIIYTPSNNVMFWQQKLEDLSWTEKVTDIKLVRITMKWHAERDEYKWDESERRVKKLVQRQTEVYIKISDCWLSKKVTTDWEQISCIYNLGYSSYESQHTYRNEYAMTFWCTSCFTNSFKTWHTRKQRLKICHCQSQIWTTNSTPRLLLSKLWNCVIVQKHRWIMHVHQLSMLVLVLYFKRPHFDISDHEVFLRCKQIVFKCWTSLCSAVPQIIVQPQSKLSPAKTPVRHSSNVLSRFTRCAQKTEGRL